MQVKEIMSENFISVSPDDTVSKLISLIESDNLREVIITENEKLKGIAYSKDISNKGIIDPTKTKISNLMRFPPPTVSSNQDINEAAELIFKTGLRSLPVIENEKMIGIITLSDIIDVASKTKEFRQTMVESIMSYPEIIDNDTDIGKARILMREKNISRLPIVDKNQKLVGIVTIFDLLKAVKPRERMDFYSMSAEKEKIMGIPVSTIMNTMPVTVEKNKSLNDVVNLMKKYKTDGITIVENNKPIGIVTLKDLLELYISGLKKKGFYYQISGLTDEDDFIVSTIDRMIRDTLQKLSKILNPQFFFLHVKKYDKKGKVKYSIRTRFRTDKGIFVSKSHAWDLRDAVNDALDKLERIMIKEIKSKRDKTQEMLRFKKMNV
jgi:CBS domain-containing protein/ribosome-associated translation inhibitor RaiA